MAYRTSTTVHEVGVSGISLAARLVGNAFEQHISGYSASTWWHSLVCSQ